MLENIKSVFFIKFLFGSINDKRILELIKYNKKFQNILDIKLINYKLFSDCYIIFEKNGKGKEYYLHNEELKFEGEYLNGKRNWKGKEYNSIGKLIYDGDYLNGKRHGFGIEYFNIKDLAFKGEFKDNKKWNGKVYDINNINFTNNNNIFIIYDVKGLDNNEEMFECELKDGKGICKIYKSSSLLFKVEYKNGELSGKGTVYYPNNTGKILFEGEYLNDKKWNGKGYDINGDKIYELINGRGHIKQYIHIYDQSNCYFECDFINGQKNGKYKKYYNNKLVIEREYKDDKKYGKGKYYNKDIGELEFEGEYLYDWKIKGKEYIKGKLRWKWEYSIYFK